MLKLIVVLVIVVFAVVIICNIKAKKSNQNETENHPVIKSQGKTKLFSEWSICQLSSDKNGVILKEQRIDLNKCKSPAGFTIGRNIGSDFIIDDPTCETGNCHLRIGNDQKGYFGIDNDSINHTYILNNGFLEKVKCFDLTSDKVFYLAGEVPIWFKHNQKSRFVNAPIDVPVKHNDISKANTKIYNIGTTQKSIQKTELPLKRL